MNQSDRPNKHNQQGPKIRIEKKGEGGQSSVDKIIGDKPVRRDPSATSDEVKCKPGRGGPHRRQLDRISSGKDTFGYKYKTKLDEPVSETRIQDDQIAGSPRQEDDQQEYGNNYFINAEMKLKRRLKFKRNSSVSGSYNILDPKKLLLGVQYQESDEGDETDHRDGGQIDLYRSRNTEFKASPEECQHFDPTYAYNGYYFCSMCSKWTERKSYLFLLQSSVLITQNLMFCVQKSAFNSIINESPFVVGLLGPKTTEKLAVITQMSISPHVVPSHKKLSQTLSTVDMYVTPDSYVFLDVPIDWNVNFGHTKHNFCMSHSRESIPTDRQNASSNLPLTHINIALFALRVCSIVILVTDSNVKYSARQKGDDYIFTLINSAHDVERELFGTKVARSKKVSNQLGNSHSEAHDDSNYPKFVWIQLNSGKDSFCLESYVNMSCYFANSLNFPSDQTAGSGFSTSAFDDSYSNLAHKVNGKWVPRYVSDRSLQTQGNSHDLNTKNTSVLSELSEIINSVDLGKTFRLSPLKFTLDEVENEQVNVNLNEDSKGSPKSVESSLGSDPPQNSTPSTQFEQPNLVLVPPIYGMTELGDGRRKAPYIQESNYVVMLKLRNSLLRSKKRTALSLNEWLDNAYRVLERIGRR